MGEKNRQHRVTQKVPVWEVNLLRKALIFQQEPLLLMWVIFGEGNSSSLRYGSHTDLLQLWLCIVNMKREGKRLSTFETVNMLQALKCTGKTSKAWKSGSPVQDAQYIALFLRKVKAAFTPVQYEFTPTPHPHLLLSARQPWTQRPCKSYDK